jgi:hypothetical protein
MSNPFATFRKNQTYWMAALVLVAILSFIVAPAIEVVTRSFRGASGGDQVLVRWDGGRLTQRDLEETQRKRVRLREFLTALAKKVITNGGEPNVPGFMNLGGQMRLGIDDDTTPNGIWMSKVLMTHAKKLGIEFDDWAADEFLREFCDQKVSDAEFNELLTSSQLSIFDLREQLKQNLTVQCVQLAMSSAASPSPIMLWHNFLRLNQTSKVEAFPISVDSFNSKVTARPTEAQIEELYEQGKSRASHPDLPDAGFAKLAQVNVEYVESSDKTWIEKEKPLITEEEIEAEYQKLVKADSPTIKVPQEFKAPDADAAPTTPGTDPAATTPATPGEQPSTPPDADPNTPSVSPATPPAPNPGEPPQPAADPAVNPGEPPAAPSEPPKQPESDNPQSRLDRPSKTGFRLVSLAQEEQPQGENQPESKPTAETAQTEPAPAQTEPAPAQTEPAPAQTEPAVNPSDSAPTAPTGQDAAGADNSNVAVAEPGKPMRVMTLDEAREKIRTQIADQRASVKSRAVMTELQTLMRNYYGQYRQWESIKNADVSTRSNIKEPTRPDLKKFAEANGLNHGVTGLQDRISMAATPFGGTFMFAGNRIETAANVATSPEVQLFEPMNSQMMGADANQLYTFWKTDFKPEYIPSLSEVRAQVEDAWKRLEARKLADQAANDLAKKLGSGEDPWSTALSETERSLVITTEPFSWLSRLGNEVRVTSVPKLDRVSETFMKQVFQTEVGKSGVAANNPKNIYYVFRVLEREPDITTLQGRFEKTTDQRIPRELAENELQNTSGSWQERVIKELNVEFQ